MKPRLVFVIVFLFGGIELFCQSPFFRKHPLPIEYKNAGITCLLQDRNRFLWYGTTVGIVRFDGSAHKHFAEFAGKENNVTALYEDSHGVIWIGYKNGRIGRIADERFRERFPDSLASEITGFAEDIQHNVWISSYGDGLRVVSAGGTMKLGVTQGLSDDFVYAITSDKKGNVFAGTDQGISVLTMNEGKIRSRILADSLGLRDKIITALSVDESGRLWTGSESAGISYYDSLQHRFSYPVSSWVYGRVTSIIPANETVWVGTRMSGLIEAGAKGDFVNILNEEDSSLPKRVNDLVLDAEGNLWLASGAAFAQSGHPLFSFLRGHNGQATGNIQAILYSKTGNIIFSSSDGVWSLKPHSNTSRPQRLNFPGLEGAQVISLYEDSSGNIWFGMFDKGVYRYDPSTGNGRFYSERDGLVNNNVLSIAGTNGEIWFATLGGVSRCDLGNTGPLSFRNYTEESGLGSNYIYKIYIDSKKRVWFATDGKGVSVMENNVFRNFSLKEGLRSDIIYSVTEDATGQIWVSTSNTGIYRFVNDGFEPFTPHNGLRDLSISSIIGEKNGNILLVSREGIDVLDPKSGAVFYHGQEFGFTDIDPNLNAYTIDNEKNIWMGSQAGIVKYNTNIRPMEKWPVTRINEMQIFLSKADSVERNLTHNQNHISFDYIGFWYHDPEEVSYRIKLDGHDREWVNSKNSFITYPNLPPGEYTFRVMSSATNHFEGAVMQTRRFTIAPPFYNESWFYALTAFCIIGIGYLFVKTRERQLKEKERVEKEKITFQFETLKNQVNPHFLFNSFNTLAGVIEEDRDTAIAYVHKLSDFYRDILVNREKDVIPLKLELDMIGNYYFLQMKRYKDNFRLLIDVPEQLLNYQIPPLTLQLLVENAIKHNVISRDRPLEVRIFTVENYLIVENNLQKKLIHEPSTGLGLSNIISRFRLLTGKPVSVEETAAHFRVRLPLIIPET